MQKFARRRPAGQLEFTVLLLGYGVGVDSHCRPFHVVSGDRSLTIYTLEPTPWLLEFLGECQNIAKMWGIATPGGRLEAFWGQLGRPPIVTMAVFIE